MNPSETISNVLNKVQGRKDQYQNVDSNLFMCCLIESGFNIPPLKTFKNDNG